MDYGNFVSMPEQCVTAPGFVYSTLKRGCALNKHQKHIADDRYTNFEVIMADLDVKLTKFSIQLLRSTLCSCNLSGSPLSFVILINKYVVKMFVL